MPLIAQLFPVVFGMKVGGGAHYWVWSFRKYGHVEKLMAPRWLNCVID
jgi:hypothetical protein